MATAALLLAGTGAAATTTPLTADLTASKGSKPTALANGATVVRADAHNDDTTGYYAGKNALDENTYTRWLTKAATDQELIVDLGREVLVDRLLLRTSSYTDGVKDFEVHLSTTGTALTDFALAASGINAQGTVESTTSFTPATARYLRFVAKTGWGGTRLSIYELHLLTPDREGGIVSLKEGPTATATATSGGYPHYAIDASTSSSWYSGYKQVTGQRLTATLPEHVDGIGAVRLLGGGSTAYGYHPDSFEVLVSTTGTADADFTSVLSANLANTGAAQEFTFPAVAARHVQLLVHTNHGSPYYIAVADFDVLVDSGANVAAGAGVGGEVVDVSSAYSSWYDGRDTIAHNARPWITATGAAANQHITTRLSPLRPGLVDRVELRSPNNNDAPRNVEVRISTTGTAPADFTTVAAHTIPVQLGTASITFPPTAARYVQVFVIDNHGGDQVRIESLRVWSPAVGGATVPFVDRSSGGGTITAWQWDFGDGATSTARHPVHTYAAPGAYDVTLTVTDDQGTTASVVRSYEVLAPPDAGFTWTPTTPAEGQYARFTSAAPNILVHRWDWGDGSWPGTAASVSHRYGDNGTYTVTHDVTDVDLLTATSTATVTVTNVAPNVEAGSNASVYALEPVGTTSWFHDPGWLDTHTCTWDWGDGTTTTVTSCTSWSSRVSHTYTSVGTFTATLTVTDDDGASNSDNRTVTVLPRPSFVHVVDATPGATGLDVTARLYDERTMDARAGEPLTITRGTETLSGVTDTAGYVSVTFPGSTADETVEASYAGDAIHQATTTIRKIAAPRADLAFIIDESGSMGGHQDAVRQRVADVARQLSREVDFRIGIVGYGGAGAHGPAGHAHATFTDDLGVVADALDDLVVNGGTEPGFNATTVAMDDAMGFRANSGVCATIITDEDADIGAAGSGYEETKADALAALDARDAVFFGIVTTSGTSEDDYGPNPGSLVAETGGATFNLYDFAHDPDPVVAGLLDRCVTEVLRPDLRVAVTDGVDAAIDDATLTYQLTVTNVGANTVTGVDLTDELPAGAVFDSASDGGTEAGGVVSWPAFDLAPGHSVVRTVTVTVDPSLAVGTHTFTDTARVTDAGVNGIDRNLDDNVAVDTTDVYMRPATTLTLDPAVATVASGDDTATVHVPDLTATLADVDGAPVAGRTVTFLVDGVEACTAVTDGDGVARCSATVEQELAVVLAGGYDAVFAGDDLYKPSEGHGALLTAAGTTVPGG